MKKIYLIPQTEVVVIKTESLMQQISGNGNGVNFEEATTGSDGEEANSRGGFFWDDED